MKVRLLDSTTIFGRGGVLRLDRSAERRLLAALALNPGFAFPLDTLVDRVWPADAAPTDPLTTLLSYAKNIRGHIVQAGGDQRQLP